MKLRKRIKWVLPVALAMALIAPGVAIAASVTVDLFSAGLVNIIATPTITEVWNYSTGTGIIGTERDTYLNWQSGAGDIVLQIDYSDSNRLALSVGDSVKGKAIITWDGDDTNPALDPVGLQVSGVGVDLTGTSTNDGILVTIYSWDGNNVDIKFTIYTDGSNYSLGTLQLRGAPITTPVAFSLSFADNFTVAGGSGATFSNIGAVQMEIDGTLVAGADVSLNVTVTGPSRDLGDLPSTYNNTHVLPPDADNGARHTLGNVYLGASIDAELDGQESGNSTGDDLNGDDEDGITVVGSTWDNGAGGGTVAISYNAPGTFKLACISGWIDWNNDGDFNDTFDAGLAPENVLNKISLNFLGGSNYSFNVPAGTFAGDPKTFNSRWRIYPDTNQNLNCSDDGVVVSVTGSITNGEVEDYQWPFGPTAVTLISLTAEPQVPNNWAAILGISLLLISSVIALIYKRRRA